jgi:hypothetical protein
MDHNHCIKGDGKKPPRLMHRAGRAGTRHWTRLRFSEPQGASTLRLLRCSRVSAAIMLRKANQNINAIFASVIINAFCLERTICGYLSVGQANKAG